MHGTPTQCTSQGKIKSLEQIYLFSLPVKEYQIVDYFLVGAREYSLVKSALSSPMLVCDY